MTRLGYGAPAGRFGAGAVLLVIWGPAELIGVCGSRFFGDDHR